MKKWIGVDLLKETLVLSSLLGFFEGKKEGKNGAKNDVWVNMRIIQPENDNWLGVQKANKNGLIYMSVY